MKKTAVKIPKPSHHAAERGRERLSLSVASVERMAELALERGLKLEETAGRLRRYLDHKRHQHPGAHCRIYGEVLFFFRGKTLVTVFQVPREHLACVAKIRAAKRAHSGGGE